jgi:leucine-zipper of insertion element IS481/Integrase core domain
VVHANAVLTPRGRLLLARCVVDDDWPIARAAEHFHVSWPTAKRWASRYAAMGVVGMTDRSSRPHRSPRRTQPAVVRRIVVLRWRHRLSPLAIASRLSIPASTVHAVLVRCRLNRLSHIDIRTGEQIRRYEHDRPGALLHVDVKKLGNIPAGGGWRFVGRAQGHKNRATTPGITRRRRQPHLGYAFVHTVIDDHSRVAYAEIHDNETADIAIAVLRRAVSWFSARGVSVERVLSDNGSCYKSPPGATRAPNCRSSTSGPGHTDPRPTAKSSDSIAQWPPNGPSPAITPTNSLADQPSQHGSIATITTGNTQR